MNFIPARLTESADGPCLLLGDGKTLALPAPRRPQRGVGDRAVVLGLRPEHIGRARDGTLPPGRVRLETAIELIQPTGSRTYVTFPLGGVSVMAEVESHDVQRPGEPIAIDVDMNRAVLIDPETDRVM
jgi:multiple sugar transport system ATP-binding protein